MQQEMKSGERSIMRELVPDWRPARRQVLWTIRIVFVLVVVLSILTLVGWPFDVTLWNWLDLLIIPVVLAIGGFLFTRSENRATQAAAERRAQDTALQAYLDQMGQLLLDRERPLRQSKDGDEVRTLARARTSTVALMLGGLGRGSLVQFLYEAGLIGKDDPVIALTDVYLQRAYLQDAHLGRAYLREAFLEGAYLHRANLSDANIQYTWLSGANLSFANLISADLSGSDLSGADLSYANLRGADLSYTDLSLADLRRALGWTEDQLSEASTLEDATMPDGQQLQGDAAPDGPTFEEWLKSQDRKEGAENE